MKDLYAGIEHQQTDEVVQCLKLISHQVVRRLFAMLLNMLKIMDAKK